MTKQPAKIVAFCLISLTLWGCSTVPQPIVITPDIVREGPGLQNFFKNAAPAQPYKATPNHVQVGFRWQPTRNRPLSSEHDIELEIGEIGSYATFWYMSLHTLPKEKNLDYENTPSAEALAIRHAVKLCKARGIKTELVFWQVPLWMNGGTKYYDFKQPPKDPQQIYDMVKKTVEWFGTDVDYYGLCHEVNHPLYWDGTQDELIEQYVLPAARAIRDYSNETGDKKVVSTAGLSPSMNCKEWYTTQLKYPELMGLIDNFALNLSDHRNGFGGGGPTKVKSGWDQVDYMRSVLDEAGYTNKGIAAAESWVSWDDRRTAHGMEAEGGPTEATLSILGESLQRGLSQANLPWADNNSNWSMGLTKRLDYNGKLAELGEPLYPNAFGGAPISSRRIAVFGGDDKLTIRDGAPDGFDKVGKVAPYGVLDDPNHTHYYIWRWLAQLSAGPHECVRHAIAGEKGNDILVPGWNTDKMIRISSYDVTAKRFIVLIAQHDPNPVPAEMTIEIPAQIRKGANYHQDGQFVGQGIAEGQTYRVRWTTENVDPKTGYRTDKTSRESGGHIVKNGKLRVTIPASRRLTTVIFEQE